MKNYFNTILILSLLLIIFPLLGFPELWENIYVVVIAFAIAYTSMLLRHKVLKENDEDSEASLQDYVKELKDRFQQHKEDQDSALPSKRISDISIDEK